MSTTEALQQFLKDFKNAQLPAIEQAAKDGDAQAQFQMGVLYANGRGVKADQDQAAQWLKLAADQGIYPAQTLLGWIHASARDVPGSAAAAMKWYARAAAVGDADAQCALADLYHDGAPGVERTPRAMREWYERAANQGHPKAQYMLGKLLADGELLQQDDEGAFRWLTLAIMSGSEPAQRELQMLTARLGSVQIETYKQRMMESMQTTH